MNKVKNAFYILLTFLILGYFIYRIFHRVLTDYFLNSNAQITKAVIIDDKNYLPNSYVKFPYSYSYEFKINGKIYKNDSHDSTLKIGDSIEIEYYKKWPSFNKPLHPKE
jgi:hypothetical protein